MRPPTVVLISRKQDSLVYNKKEGMKLGGRGDRRVDGELGGGVGDGYDQDVFYTCVKFLKNK